MMLAGRRPADGIFSEAVMQTAVADELTLVERCRSGDAAAFDSLVAKYASQVYNLAYRMVGDPDDADDVAQEVFLRVHRAIKSFRGSSSFTTWIYRVATNVCLDELKRRKRRPALAEWSEQEEAAVDPSPAGLGDPEATALRRERQDLVQRAIRSLPEAQRAVLVLYDLQGLSYDEIAEALGASLGTVKSRLNRARVALKSKLARHLELLR
jgi:RNA polymerase sigma-70 factor (ECF subfamily)